MEETVFKEIDTDLEFEKLLDEIHKNFLSLNAVCKEAGVHASIASNWRRKLHKPTPRLLNKLKAGLKRLLDKRDAEGR